MILFLIIHTFFLTAVTFIILTFFPPKSGFFFFKKKVTFSLIFKIFFLKNQILFLCMDPQPVCLLLFIIFQSVVCTYVSK